MVTMTYDSLIAPKGTVGSILNWVGYSKIDVATVLDEAQLILWELGMRVREMRSEFVFGLIAGKSAVPLPPSFLDPIGRIYDLTNSTAYDQVIETNVMAGRSYDNTITGSFGTNPFTTVSGSSLVTVAKTAEPFNQDSTITIAAATSPLNGLIMNGTFPVVDVTDANDFIIDVGDVNGGAVANASGSGGGSAATYTGNNLIAGSPSRWGIWNEQLKFDTALDLPASMKLLYYKQPALLSLTNESNFLTVRYRRLLRQACNTAAADYMKDSTEYQKGVQALSQLIQSTMATDDLSYRGATIGTDTPP
jgi:hypothetical protein